MKVLNRLWYGIVLLILMYIGILFSWIIIPVFALYWIATEDDPVEIALNFIRNQLKVIKKRHGV